MTPVPVFWLSNHDDIDAIGPWDTGLLRHLFEGRLGRLRHTFTSTWTTEREIPDDYYGKPGIVVLPARHHYSVDDLSWLNVQVGKLSSCLLILCGDEDAKFPWNQIRHPWMRFWVQMPDPRNYSNLNGSAFYFGNGYRYEWPDAIAAARRAHPDRDLVWAFSGQVTNTPRKLAANGLAAVDPSIPHCWEPTDGFARGRDLDGYAGLMADTWIAPAPGGPRSVDTFRLYEALEAGCIPIVDAIDADGRVTPYWENLYGDDIDNLMAIVDNWRYVDGVIDYLYERRYHIAARTGAWWIYQQRLMVDRLCSDLVHLGPPAEQPKLTALITSSPVPSNPSLDVIGETIASIPQGVDVVVACDGVRPEQRHLTERYDEFLYRLVEACQTDPAYARVTPYISPTWLHQAALTRAVLADPILVRTPALLFLEHDTPLCVDEHIDWDALVPLVVDGYVDMIRFHHESLILPVHYRLMLDHQTQMLFGAPVRRTVQWSQRPHLASASYYRRILHDHFTPSARTMIEDAMHKVVQWQPGHRIVVYHPDGSIKRSYHLDARGDEPKFEETFVF